jgi:hypothetical protein
MQEIVTKVNKNELVTAIRINQITDNYLLENNIFYYLRHKSEYLCLIPVGELREIKSQIKLTPSHLESVRILIEKLFHLSKNYGKNESCILTYTSELAKFPIDILQEFLDFNRYNGEFPSLFEIIDKINKYGGLKGKFFVELYRS